MLVSSFINPLPNNPISDAERSYIREGVDVGLRADGRGCEEWRQIIARRSVIDQAAGSAEVRIGNSHVTVGILGTIRDSLGSGKEEIKFNVDMSSASRCDPRRANLIEDKMISTLESELESILREIYVESKMIDYGRLEYSSHRKSWSLSVDVLALESDGNFFDCVVLATSLAFSSLRLPKIHIEESGESFQISFLNETDPSKSFSIAELPISISLSIFGQSVLVDTTATEDSCADTKLFISFINNVFCDFRKIGPGFFDVTAIPRVVEVAQKSAEHLLCHIDSNP